jgi:hypothetical protein
VARAEKNAVTPRKKELCNCDHLFFFFLNKREIGTKLKSAKESFPHPSLVAIN